MNKKIKIAISILFMVILIGISNKVFAGIEQKKGKTYFIPDNLYTNQHTYNKYYTFYCAEKGGALRLYTMQAMDDKAREYARSSSITLDIRDSSDSENYVTNRTYVRTADLSLSKNYKTINQAVDDIYDMVEKKESIFNAPARFIENFFTDQENMFGYNENKGWDGIGENNFKREKPSKDEVVTANVNTQLRWQINTNEYTRVVDFLGPIMTFKPEYNMPGTVEINKNNRLSYLVSSGINVPSITNENGKTTNYEPTISDELAADQDRLQKALWQDAAPSEAHLDGTAYYNKGYRPNETDEKALAFYDEAVTYEKFYNKEIKNGYNASFDKTNPQAIVNRSERSYTVGPFIMQYPNNDKFSYVEDMWITNQTGEITRNFEIIKEDTTKTYPASGKIFFIKFNASAFNGDSTSVTVHTKFNYLDTTYSKYERLTGRGLEFQAYGWADAKLVELEGQDKLELESIEIKEYNSLQNFTDGMEGDYYVTYEFDHRTNTKYYYKITKYKIVNYRYDTKWEMGVYRTRFYQAQQAMYLKINSVGIAEIIEIDSQESNTGANREWKTYEIDSSNVPVNLKIKLEGKVWVDEAATKESKVNGILGSEDTPMPNVEVVLYRFDNNAILATTYTDKNGHYEFNNLSAFLQYYVRFKYNAQYYEPTYYTSPTSYKENWKNTSNGTDYQNNYLIGQNFEGRLQFNVKFSSINSANSNYRGNAGYNETYTKKELLGYTLQKDGTYKKTREAVIDEFGRLILKDSQDATTKKMIQYVKDCEMYSWTKNAQDKKDAYPSSNIIVINNGYDRYNNLTRITVQGSSGNPDSWNGVNRIISVARDDKCQYINQGYKLRQEADMSIKDDVDHVTIEINGKTQEYKYDTRANAANAEATWEIGVRLSDAYYNTAYSREIYTSDYQYRASNYGENPTQYGKTKEDELKVYVTYKLALRNQSMSIRTRIDEIVDYFDSDLEYVPDRSYIQISRGNNKGTYAVNASTTSRYASLPGTNTTINGYQNLYIRGLDNMYLDAGTSVDIYLTFVLEKDNNDYIKLDEVANTGVAIGVGKENITEINGYSTIYKEGTEIPNVGNAGANKQAGLVDIDSKPGNLKASYVPKDGTTLYNMFEDDTDKAPNIKIVLDRDKDGNPTSRITSGYVWEDNRNVINNSQATTTGNGIREQNETLVNGVTVQLVEIMDNGTEYIWRTYEQGSGTATKTSPIINLANLVKDYTFTGDSKGRYAFTSFVPGNYIVRFTYGDTQKTVLTNNKNAEVEKILGKTGLNAKSYNGQDYKSTAYQIGLGTYDGKNTTRQYKYDIAKGDTALVSDVKDLYNVRQNVNNYSAKEIRNSLAEEISSYMSVPEYNGVKYDKNTMQTLLDSFIQKTKMTAETGIIDMEVEYNRTSTANQTLNNNNPYHLENLDLGLEERPKAQIEIVKDIKNLKITLTNGNILFDSTQGTDNLGWIKNPEYYAYENNLMKESKYGSIENIRNNRTFGLVQPTIDKEIMHGATMKITYEISAINTGEVDYNEEQFYYTGIAQNRNNPVTTNAIQLVDYVPNNLQYYEVDNNGNWLVVKTSDLIEGNNNLVNKKLEQNLNKYNTIITTTKTNTPLVPVVYTQKVNSSKASRASVPLVLTQLLSAENKDDDLDYINIVELVAQSNTAGRKMAYSVVGNQDPSKAPRELDASWEEVRILPPFGTTLTYIIISVITIAGAILIVSGIVFIKKKVLIK